MLGSIVENVVVWVTWCPGFVKVQNCFYNYGQMILQENDEF